MGLMGQNDPLSHSSHRSYSSHSCETLSMWCQWRIFGYVVNLARAGSRARINRHGVYIGILRPAWCIDLCGGRRIGLSISGIILSVLWSILIVIILLFR